MGQPILAIFLLRLIAHLRVGAGFIPAQFYRITIESFISSHECAEFNRFYIDLLYRFSLGSNSGMILSAGMVMTGPAFEQPLNE